jgi:acetyl-CoA acetyltransferase
MSKSVIVTGSRTAIGKLAGEFVTLSAQDLAGKDRSRPGQY